MSRNRVFWALAAFPALGALVNTIWPPEHYGYIREQGALVAVALAALALARKSTNGAVFFYCTAALVPVGMMLEHYGDFSPLALTPLLGIALVALLARDERALLVYGLVALGAGGVFGALVGDLGLGGTLAFLSGTLTACAVWWLDCNEQKAQTKLDELRGEARRLERIITKELANDP